MSNGRPPIQPPVQQISDEMRQQVASQGIAAVANNPNKQSTTPKSTPKTQGGTKRKHKKQRKSRKQRRRRVR